MRRLARIALFCAAMVPVQGRTDEPATPVAMPEFAVLERITPVDPMAERQTQWANPLVGLTDLVYATLPGYRPLRLDLYRESGVAAPRPLVVVVHGGGWAHANPRVGAGFKDFPSVLAYLAQRGYVVASIEYRLSGEAPFPAQVEDLQEALRFLRSSASRFGIDPDRVALWGLSAGAQIAALHATTCSRPECVRALVGWFGPYDLASYVVESPRGGSVQAYLRCEAQGCAAAQLRSASPLAHVDGRDPPTLLVHGVDDTQVLSSQSRRFAEALQAADVEAQLELVPDVGHGLIGQDAATTHRALRRALVQTTVFLDQRLKTTPDP